MVTTLPQLRGIQQPIQTNQQHTPPPPPAQKFVIVSQAQPQIIQQPVQTIQLQTQQQQTVYQSPSTPQSVLLTNPTSINGTSGIGGNGSNAGNNLLTNIGSTVVIGSSTTGGNILNRSERVNIKIYINYIC